jgi:hypothetical protein
VAAVAAFPFRELTLIFFSADERHLKKHGDTELRLVFQRMVTKNACRLTTVKTLIQVHLLLLVPPRPTRTTRKGRCQASSGSSDHTRYAEQLCVRGLLRCGRRTDQNS